MGRGDQAGDDVCAARGAGASVEPLGLLEGADGLGTPAGAAEHFAEEGPTGRVTVQRHRLPQRHGGLSVLAPPGAAPGTVLEQRSPIPAGPHVPPATSPSLRHAHPRPQDGARSLRHGQLFGSDT